MNLVVDLPTLLTVLLALAACGMAAVIVGERRTRRQIRRWGTQAAAGLPLTIGGRWTRVTSAGAVRS